MSASYLVEANDTILRRELGILAFFFVLFFSFNYM